MHHGYNDKSPTAPALRALALLALCIAPAVAWCDRAITLSAPTELARKASIATSKDEGANRIGIGRDVPAPMAAIAPRAIAWTVSGDGRQVGRFSVRSEAAVSMRLALAVHGKASGARLRVGSGDGVMTASRPLGEALEATASFGAYWTAVTPGDEQVVEIELPPGADASLLRLSVPVVSHLLADPASVDGGPALGKAAAASCNLDLACMANPRPALMDAARSVAKLVYTVDGATYACTGTLVRGQAAPAAAYVLTAKHCIDSAAAAATVNTFWFLEAASCGSKSGAQAKQLTAGARLLYSGSASDVALIVLKEEAPEGAWASEIDATPLEAGESAVALHHPRGDLKKVSSGMVMGAAEGTGRNLTSVSWLFGTTETGSSGSALFGERDGRYRVRGTLRGGSASCENSGQLNDPANRDYYARLDADIESLRRVLEAARRPLEDSARG
jgi:hypothetical protein